jgi:hypothetical protein
MKAARIASSVIQGGSKAGAGEAATTIAAAATLSEAINLEDALTPKAAPMHREADDYMPR